MKRVLVVDGSPMARRFIAYTLKMGGHAALEAEDGIDALEKLSTFEVDAALVELYLPNMDGLAFVKSMRNNFNFLHLPMVMLSMVRRREVEREAREAGCDLVLYKPLTSAELLGGIDSLLKEKA